jgi:hypothetical protein
MTKPLRRITHSPKSDGLNTCPTVLAEGELDVILQGYELDEETRRTLNIPAGENAIRMPKTLYLEGARRLAEGA